MSEPIDSIGEIRVQQDMQNLVPLSEYEEEVFMVKHWLERDRHHHMEDDRKGRYVLGRLYELGMDLNVRTGDGWIRMMPKHAARDRRHWLE